VQPDPIRLSPDCDIERVFETMDECAPAVGGQVDKRPQAVDNPSSTC
jgi:hypothetical protein